MGIESGGEDQGVGFTDFTRIEQEEPLEAGGIDEQPVVNAYQLPLKFHEVHYTGDYGQVLDPADIVSSVFSGAERKPENWEIELPDILAARHPEIYGGEALIKDMPGLTMHTMHGVLPTDEVVGDPMSPTPRESSYPDPHFQRYDQQPYNDKEEQ